MSLILSHDELFAFAEQERGLYEDLLKAFVGVPTVSSEPDRQRNIKRGVELAKETIGRGVDRSFRAPSFFHAGGAPGFKNRARLPFRIKNEKRATLRTLRDV